MKNLSLGGVLLGFAFGLVFWTAQPRDLGAVPAPKEKTVFIDLQSKANHKLKDDFHGGSFPGNNLAAFTKGEKKLGGIKFSIGAGLLQLGSTNLADQPDKIEGIKVGHALAKLHILHACGYREEENTGIGSYIIHYADKTKATIEIAYGKDVRDWWASEDLNEVTRGKLAWEGTNAAVKERKHKIRLFLTTWKNPHPKKKVVSIDYTSANTKSAPFCVAMTAEAK
jgi:hypothetical protein